MQLKPAQNRYRLELFNVSIRCSLHIIELTLKPLRKMQWESRIEFLKPLKAQIISICEIIVLRSYLQLFVSGNTGVVV